MCHRGWMIAASVLSTSLVDAGWRLPCVGSPLLVASARDAGGDVPPGPNGVCYGAKCNQPALQGLFPLPRMMLRRPDAEFLTTVAAEEPEVVDVPNRGSTAQACLFNGRRLNPAVFPKGAFINERRALLTARLDFRTNDPNTMGGIYKDDGEKFYRRGVVAMKRLEFLNLDWS